MTDIRALLNNDTTGAALNLAWRWCEGHRIGDDEALAHALRVVDVLHRHIPDVAPEVVAAALLHDSPDLVPPGIDLDTNLATFVSPEVARLVRALQHEHDGLDTGTAPSPPVQDLPLMQASAADKIVSVQAVLDRAKTSDDLGAYWTQRQAFVAALPYFRAFHRAAEWVLPPAMAIELGVLVDRAEQEATHAHDHR